MIHSINMELPLTSWYGLVSQEDRNSIHRASEMGRILSVPLFDIKKRLDTVLKDLMKQVSGFHEKLEKPLSLEELKKLMIKTTIGVAKASADSDIPLLISLYRLRIRIAIRFHEDCIRSNRPETSLLKSAVIDLMVLQRLSSQNDASMDSLVKQVNHFRDETKEILPISWEDLDEGYLSSPSSGYISGSSQPEFPMISFCWSPTKGNYLRLNQKHKAIEAGQEVLTEDASVWTLKVCHSYYHCYECFKKIDRSVFKCPAMCPVVFCSARCFSEGKSIHEKECQVLHFLMMSGVHLQMTFRSVVRGIESSRFLELTHHFFDYDKYSKVMSCIKTLFIKTLLEDVITSSPSLGFHILITLSQIQVNNICIKNKRRVGNGIYTTFSRICHSCTPNVICKFDGRRIRLMAKETILPGQEITFSYLGSSDEQVVPRRNHLKQTFLFDCYCGACFRDLVLESDDPKVYQPLKTCSTCSSNSLNICRMKNESLEGFECERTVNPGCLSKCDIPNLNYFRSILSSDVLDVLSKNYLLFISQVKSPNPLSLCFEDSIACLFLKKGPKGLDDCSDFAKKSLLSSIKLLGQTRTTAFLLLRFIIVDVIRYNTNSETEILLGTAIQDLYTRHGYVAYSLIEYSLIEFGLNRDVIFSQVISWLKRQEPLFLHSNPTSFQDKCTN